MNNHLIAITIGRLIGWCIGTLCRLVFFVGALGVWFVGWLLAPLFRGVGLTRSGEPEPYVPHPVEGCERSGQVLGVDEFGCVMGEDWDDGGGGDWPAGLDPGPPRHGKTHTPPQLSDERDQRIPWPTTATKERIRR